MVFSGGASESQGFNDSRAVDPDRELSDKLYSFNDGLTKTLSRFTTRDNLPVAIGFGLRPSS